jgi:hypothetical protein
VIIIIISTVHKAFQVATTSVYRAEKPVRNERYKRFVKSFACAACEATRDVDPCHTGPHGLSVKGCDLKVIPLCRPCHEAMGANPKAFAKRYGLNVPKLIKSLNALWAERQRRTA